MTYDDKDKRYEETSGDNEECRNRNRHLNSELWNWDRDWNIFLWHWIYDSSGKIVLSEVEGGSIRIHVSKQNNILYKIGCMGMWK